MRNYIKSKMLYRYFLSYLLIFMIPFVALVFLIYQSAIATLQEEIELTSQQKLEQIKGVLDREFKRLEETANHISFDPDLTPYMVQRMGYPTSDTINTLARYRQMTTIANDVLLYFHGDDVIYSSAGMSNLKTLSNYQYAFTEWSYEQFVEDINSTSYPVVRPTVNRESPSREDSRMLTYLFPIPANKGAHYATVMFMLPETLLSDMMDNVLGVMDGSLYIVDESFNLLTSDVEGEKADAEKILPEIRRATEPGIDTIRVDNMNYSVISVESEINKWRYIVTIPADQFLNSVVKVKTLVQYLAIFLLLFGCTAAFILAINQYRPIRSLVELVTTGKKQRERPANELQFVRESITEVFNQSRDLQEQMDQQRKYVKEHLVYRLLHGDMKHSEEISTFLAEDKLYAEDRLYFVILISVDQHQEKAEQRRSWIREISDHVWGDYAYTYAMELMSEGLIAVVCHIPRDTPVLDVIQQRVLEPIRQSAVECIKGQVTVGSGGLCDSLIKMNRSYIEALTAMEYKFQVGVDSVIVFDEIQSFEGNNDWFPLKEQTKLVLSMKQGDPDVACETVDVIIASIASREQSILIVKCMCYDLINTILKTTKEMKVRNQPALIKHLLELDSLERLRSGLHGWMQEICEEVNAQKDSGGSYLCAKLVEYIEANFKEYDFSLEQAAHAFGLSTSYISRIFKESTGSTFSDYAVTLRMAEVKKALLQTTRPIKDIIQEVGYVDTSSFIKKFKKIEGMTPKEYRDYYSQGAE